MAYISLFFIVMFSFYFVNNKKTCVLCVRQLNYLYFLLLLFIFILFYGLRWDVGVDYMSYYKNAVNKSYMKVQKGTGDVFEKGFQALYFIGDFFELPLNTFMILGGTLIFGFIFKSIYENSENLMLSCFAYFSSGLFFYSFNEFRQFVAVSIIFYGYRYCTERKIFKWFLFCLLAFLFHRTAIVFSIMYLFVTRKYSRLFINACLLGALVLKQIDIVNVMKFLLGFLPGRYAGYAYVFDAIKNGGSGAISYLYALIILIMNNTKRRDSFYFGKNITYFNLFVLATVLLNIFCDFYMFTRIAEYFLVSIVIVFPLFYKVLKKSYFGLLFFYFVFGILFLNICKFAIFSASTMHLEYHTIFSRG